MALTSKGPPTRGSIVGRSIILTACMAQIMIVLDSTIVVVALPDAQSDLGFLQGDRQWVITAYSLAFGALLLVGGRLAERWGLVPSYRIAIVGFGVASAVGGLATSFTMLVAARTAQGVFAALLGPTNLAMMSNGFSKPEERSKAFAVFGATAGAGAALGLILGGVLTEFAGWRWCFYVNIAFTLAGLVLVRRAAPAFAVGSQQQHPTDYLSLLVGSLGMFAVIFGLSQASTHPWVSLEVLANVAVGVALGLLFFVRLRRARHPLVPPALLAQPVRLAACLVVLMVGIAQLVSSIYLSYFLQRVQGWSAFATGMAMTPLVVGLVAAAVISAGVLVPRFGIAPVFLAGLLVLTCAFALLSRLDTSWGYLPLLLPLIAIGIGIGAVMPVAVSAVTTGVDPAHAGVASSLSNSCQQLGGSLGVAAATSFAVSQAAGYVTDHSSRITGTVASLLKQAGTGPDTAPGRQIVAQARLEAEHAAETWAYSRGFLAMALLYVVVAVAVFVVARRGAPSVPEGTPAGDGVEAPA